MEDNLHRVFRSLVQRALASDSMAVSGNQRTTSAQSTVFRRYPRIRMAYYLIRAKPKLEWLAELQTRLAENAFVNLRPFGKALTHSLNEARSQPDGTAVWEEEDYCSPPLAQERAAVLDRYFDEISVEQVNVGEGWKQIEALPKLSTLG
jgi:hypothetical protein